MTLPSLGSCCRLWINLAAGFAHRSLLHEFPEVAWSLVSAWALTALSQSCLHPYETLSVAVWTYKLSFPHPQSQGRACKSLANPYSSQRTLNSPVSLWNETCSSFHWTPFLTSHKSSRGREKVGPHLQIISSSYL